MSIDATTCPSPRADVADEPALLPLVGRDTLVPLVDGRHVTYANLDVAASAPALEAVAARVAQALPLYASVHRGAGYLSQVSTALYEASRRSIGASSSRGGGAPPGVLAAISSSEPGAT